ncbi:MAG TPA: hypothetical protein ENN08_02065 [Bacteroidales bacterium]|nr:hypothetical protein [Bacteroidales bacterium]
MKSKTQKSDSLKRNFTTAAMILLASVISLSSCNKDDDEGDPPSIAVTTETASNIIGNEVSTTLNINAPEGLQSLTILKNGIIYNTESFSGETSVAYEFKYVIEEMASGSVVNFTFQALDKLNRTSAVKVFSVKVTSKEIVEISGSITGEVTWTKDKIWRLNGYVRVQDGGKLHIEEGTLVIGDRESKGTLIVQMGGQIFAVGTREEPIIMTSERAPGLREPGDWGGLVICGRANNNVTAVTGQPVELEGGYGAFHGGNADNDNSGIVRFVRIEYAGVPINPNEEVNSLTMGSVGRGTQIDYVMCSYGLDDAFEWFGGTSDHKYLIDYRGLDDDLDVDLGYSGRVQYALGIRGAS